MPLKLGTVVSALVFAFSVNKCIVESFIKETPGFGNWSVINVVEASSSLEILTEKPASFSICFASEIVLPVTSGRTVVV